jgi:hypothetical protein
MKNKPTFRQRLLILVAALVAAVGLFTHVARACDYATEDSGTNPSCVPGSAIVTHPDVVVSETVPTQICPANINRIRATVCNSNSNASVSNTPARSGDANISATQGDPTQWGPCLTYRTTAAIYGIATSSANTTFSCSEIER